MCIYRSLPVLYFAPSNYYTMLKMCTYVEVKWAQFEKFLHIILWKTDEYVNLSFPLFILYRYIWWKNSCES